MDAEIAHRLSGGMIDSRARGVHFQALSQGTDADASEDGMTPTAGS
jgi:hypothetical protein